MKHRVVPVLLATSAMALALTGCAGLAGDLGKTVTQDRDISAATALSLRTSGDVTLTIGSEPSLTITAGDKVIDDLTSEVRNGVLILDEEGSRFGSLGRITYALVLPSVEAITVDGSGSIDAELTTAETLSVAINGSGDLMGEGVDVTTLTAQIAGSGSADLIGNAVREAVTIAGSGDFRGADLVATDAAVVVEGSGGADVHVTGTLDAVISGSGSITHTGGATVTSNVSGSGNVEEG